MGIVVIFIFVLIFTEMLSLVPYIFYSLYIPVSGFTRFLFQIWMLNVANFLLLININYICVNLNIINEFQILNHTYIPRMNHS